MNNGGIERFFPDRNAAREQCNGKTLCLPGGRIGIGGVGSFTVEALARAGVGKLLLVDDDCICLTNLNRQLHATTKTVGRFKVDVMRERVLDINPLAEVEILQKFYLPENAAEFFQSSI